MLNKVHLPRDSNKVDGEKIDKNILHINRFGVKLIVEFKKLKSKLMKCNKQQKNEQYEFLFAIISAKLMYSRISNDI